METLAQKPVNPFRISVKQYKLEMGIEDDAEFMECLEEMVYDGIVPALCKESCEVEPDGRCEHGCPSILIALGMI